VRAVKAVNNDLLVFNLGLQRNALPVGQVSTVVPRASLTPLPGAPADLIGLLRLHGALCPVIDIRVRLGSSVGVPHIGECIVVMHTKMLKIGLLVDGIDGVTAPEGPVRGVLEISGHVVAMLDAEAIVGNDVRAYLAAEAA
jgi:purine-binding chemotaxis protein CheW